MLLVYDAKSYTVKQIHHGYVDKFNEWIHGDEKLTQNSVILWNMPVSVPDSAGDLDPTQVKLVTSHRKEDKNRLDPNKCATITVLLPIVIERFEICLNTDNIFRFSILGRVDPSSPLQKQIPMSIQHICWIVAINPKKNWTHWANNRKFMHRKATTIPGS